MAIISGVLTSVLLPHLSSSLTDSPPSLCWITFIRVVDDTLLYDKTIKDAFYHTLDYLSLCETNGIVINKDKFQFCQDVVQFGGLQITPTGVTPSNNLLNAISSFPSPKNITDARSWFGLVNQVAWAYSLSPIMLPFWELVKKKKNSNFVWNEGLEKAFQQSKQVIVGLVKKGVTTVIIVTIIAVVYCCLLHFPSPRLVALIKLEKSVYPAIKISNILFIHFLQKTN